MKIVVIGGSGLIGSKLVNKLRRSGHEVLAASPKSGVNTLTREGLAEALAGAEVVVDVAKDGPGAEKGLKPGDMIMEAAQEEIKNAIQVAGKIDDAKRSGRKSILLLVERQGDLRFIALRLDQS